MPDGGAQRAPRVGAADDQAVCTALTKASGSNFYYAFMPLPRPEREALFVIYAFCRHADDIVDEGDDPAVAEQRLAQWRKEWQAARAGQAGHPITRRLAEVVARYGIDPSLPDALLDGMAMDLGPVRYADFDALTLYCHRVAVTVGLMCVRVFGCRHPDAERFAVAHGMAFQLTNILRDVARDAAMDRIYVPADEMARFGVTEAELLKGRYGPRVRALLAFEAERAAGYYAEAAAIARRLPREDRRALLPSRIMGAIYGALLAEMEEREFRLFSPVSLSAPRKVYLAARAYLRHLRDKW
jgi:phytoene synthase